MTGSSYATYTIGLLVGALIARQLEPGDYGRYAYVVWLAGILVLAANNGLPTTGIRFVAEVLGLEAAGMATTVRRWLYRQQAISLLVIVGGFLLVFPVFRPAGWDQPGWIFVIVILASTVTKALYLLEISVAKGYGRFGVEATTSVAVSLLNAALVFLLYLRDGSLNEYLALFAFTSAAHLVVATVLFRRGHQGVPAAAMDADLTGRIRKHLLWTVILTLVAAFSGTSVAIYMLNRLVGSAEVGFFVIAASLARGAIDLVASGLTSVLMPMMGHAFGEGGKERVGTILCDSLRYLQILGLLAAGLGGFWAEAVVVLMYGEAYEPVINILRWMLFAGGMALGESAFGALLSTTDNQRLRATFAATYLVVSLLAAGALIPYFGLTGAVIACVGARLLLYAIGLAVVTRMMALRLPWFELGMIMLSAGFSAAVAAALLWAYPGPWSGMAAGVLYVGLFLLASRCFGVWQEKDLRMVASLGEQYPHLLGWTRPFLNRWIEGLQR